MVAMKPKVALLPIFAWIHNSNVTIVIVLLLERYCYFMIFCALILNFFYYKSIATLLTIVAMVVMKSIAFVDNVRNMNSNAIMINAYRTLCDAIFCHIVAIKAMKVFHVLVESVT